MPSANARPSLRPVATAAIDVPGTIAADDESGAEDEPAQRLRREARRLDVELGHVEHPAADSTNSPVIAVTIAVNITFTTAMS